MTGMGFSETIFLFLLALLIFGPKKLPEIARQVGKALNEFRRASNDFKSQLAAEISQLEVESQRQSLPANAPPAGAVATTSQHNEPSAGAGEPPAPTENTQPVMKASPDA